MESPHPAEPVPNPPDAQIPINVVLCWQQAGAEQRREKFAQEICLRSHREGLHGISFQTWFSLIRFQRGGGAAKIPRPKERAFMASPGTGWLGSLSPFLLLVRNKTPVEFQVGFIESVKETRNIRCLYLTRGIQSSLCHNKHRS